MHRLTTLLLFLLPFAAQGQDLPLEDEEVRRYAVEMIIFTYAQDVSTGTEIFVADDPPAPPADDEIPMQIEEPVLVETKPIIRRDTEFALLDKGDLTMGEIMDRLERVEVYDPVLHIGWTQTTWPEEESEAIQLASLARLPQGLDGTLMLYLSRYLHLVVDLQLDAPDTGRGNALQRDPVSEYGDYRTRSDFGDVMQRGRVYYRITEDRIFRSGELRYFDHPKFGVLSKVTRVQEEPDDRDRESELLGYPAE